MDKLPVQEVGSEAWWEAVREDIGDLQRSYPRKDDSPEVKKARAYLGARYSRLSIERDTHGDKLMAFPYRLAELLRARKLVEILNVEYDTREQRDDLLPTLARMTIEQTE